MNSKVELLYSFAYIQTSTNNRNMRLYDICKVISELETLPLKPEVNLSWNGNASNNYNIIVGYKILKNNGFKTSYCGPITDIKYIKYAVSYIDEFNVEWNYENITDYTKQTGRHISSYLNMINGINQLYKLVYSYKKPLFLCLKKDTPNIRLETTKLLYDDIVFINSSEEDIGYPYLFGSIYIDIDLNVRLCEKSSYIIGNLRQNNLRNILEKIDLIDIKEQHLKGIVPIECSECLKHMIQGEEC